MSNPVEDAIVRAQALLTEWGHAAAVIGGIAMIVRCGTRPTEDVDVIADASATDVDALLALASKHGFSFDQDARELADMGLVRLYSRDATGLGLDVLFADNAYYEEILSRATQVTIAGATLRVATAEDLVLLKLEAGRNQDIEDVLTIKDSFGGALDLGYLRRQADRLRLRQKLDLYFGARG